MKIRNHKFSHKDEANFDFRMEMDRSQVIEVFKNATHEIETVSSKSRLIATVFFCFSLFRCLVLKSERSVLMYMCTMMLLPNTKNTQFPINISSACDFLRSGYNIAM